MEDSRDRLDRAENRARSLGRARSRGRNPSDLLARKQELLSSGQLDAIWSNGDSDSASSRSHARSLTRRAKHLDSLADSADEHLSKLESLRELLKSHQADSVDMQSSPSSTKSIEDVYILLAKKEKDLQLAAELGKALLEKNDELSKANERITEEYSHKLELLEQDKHKLKRKLDQLDGEYENRLIELQTDCNLLKTQLDEQYQLAKQVEKEKSKLIDDLVQQNQRLTSELVEATKSEELLSSQLEQMNERLSLRLSNRQDHVTQLDTLKEEIQIVNQRKQDLERRLKLANHDKSTLAGALEESGDKIVFLENLLNEKEAKLVELIDEVNELRDSSSWLSNELETMITLNEKLVKDDESTTGEESGSQQKRSQLVERLKELRLKKRSRLKANEIISINKRAHGVKSTNGKLTRGWRDHKKPKQRDGSLFDELESNANKLSNRWSEDDDDLAEQEGTLREEIMVEIYALLRLFHQTLQQRKDSFLSGSQSYNRSSHLHSPSSTDDSGISTDETSDHAQARDPALWRRLLVSLKSLVEDMPCSSCQLMIVERADYEQLQKLHAKLADEMRRKDDQLLLLNQISTEQQAKLAVLEERCKILSEDLNNCDKPKEEIVKLAWKARDEAVERKNSAEISLARTRIENMQIASQLMEVVQQKGELSQKLAQFEDDIHYITQDSVKAKFTWEEHSEQLRRSKMARPDPVASSNPLAQLLSFSMASNGGKSAAMDSITQPSSLMRNFTSNRFNLRFWQSRSLSEKAVSDKSVTNNNDLAQQSTS